MCWFLVSEIVMHWIFSKFNRTIAQEDVVAGLGVGDINFLGLHIPLSVDARRSPLEYWSGRCAVPMLSDLTLPYPFHEDYYEYIDLLEAVDRARDGRFVMVEVGAGYGRWMLNAAYAARRHKSNTYSSIDLIGFEFDPDRAKSLVMLMRESGIESYRLVEKVVVASEVHMQGIFIDCAVHKTDSSKFGGMIIDPKLDLLSGRTPMAATEWMGIEKMASCDLEHELMDFKVVDYMSFDVQNAEISIIPSYIDYLTRHVKMVHCGTHSRLADATVADCFVSAGWKPRWQYLWRSNGSIEHGFVYFRDGIQSYENPTI